MNAPNVVIVLADDLGWADLGVYGNTFFETPHIDRMAAEGTRFNRWHACPNCAPTRAAMLTGQYGARTGVYTVGSVNRYPWKTRSRLQPVDNIENLPLDRRTIADMLRSAGYATGMFGKWHLGEKNEYHPSRRGFDEAIHFSTGNHFRFTSNPPGPIPAGIYQSDYITDLGIDFINRNKRNPFFLYLPLTAAHDPLQAPKDDIVYFQAKARKWKWTGRPAYAGMIRALDRNVGRLRQALENAGVKENTVVLFLSDNGGLGGYAREGISMREYTMNDPLRGGKGMLYEGGTRVPMIVNWPGVTAPGSVCNTTGHVVDILPTIAEITGSPLPGQPRDGRSIVPELVNPRASTPPRPIFEHFPGYLTGDRADQWRITPAGSIEFDGWKLIEFFEDNRLELYHVDQDTGETVNLIGARPDVAADLRNRMRSWRAATGARMPAVNQAYRP